MDNSNYHSFHGGGGGFSHVYVIMHKYFVEKPKMQKMSTKGFIYNLTCFVTWKFATHFSGTWGHKF